MNPEDQMGSRQEDKEGDGLTTTEWRCMDCLHAWKVVGAVKPEAVSQVWGNDAYCEKVNS